MKALTLPTVCLVALTFGAVPSAGIDAKYFMVSVDALADNRGFSEQQHADFPLLSDPTKKTAEAYGVLSTLGVAHRWTFYIGKDGKIQAIDKEVNPATSAEDMAEKLHELGIPKRAPCAHPGRLR